MVEWVATAAVVQAVSTVVLVFITGYYAWYVRQQVKQAAKLVEHQARDHQARERAQIGKAVRTIDAEFQVNSQDARWEPRESPPLLDGAYRANLWAVCEIGMTPETFRALGDAMLRVAAYNLRYVVAAQQSSPANRNNCLQAWQEAQNAIRAGMGALRSDPGTMGLFRSPGGSQDKTGREQSNASASGPQGAP